MALGSYRNSPFITGDSSNSNGLKTEVLNHSAGIWVQAPDYPFSNGDRYVRKDLIKDLSFIFIKRTLEFIHFQNNILCHCFNQWKCSDHRRLPRWLWYLLINNRRIQKWKLEKCWKLGYSSKRPWYNHLRICHNGCWWLFNRIVSVDQRNSIISIF